MGSASLDIRYDAAGVPSSCPATDPELRPGKDASRP